MTQRQHPARTAPGSVCTDLLRVPVARPRPGVFVVAPIGEIDLSTAELLRDAADDAMDAAPCRVVVDLSGVTFCGSTGLVALVDMRNRADEAGIAFCTAGGGHAVRRVLEITGLGAVLGHRETVAEVLDERAAD